MAGVRTRGAGGRFISVQIDDKVLVALIKGTKGEVKPRIVADGVDYGLFVHNGTTQSRGGVLGALGAKKQRAAARPFMRKAVDAVRPGFAKAFTDQLTIKQIESVLGKTARDVERLSKQNITTMRAVDTGALRSSIHVIVGDKAQDTSPAGKVA